MTTQHRDPSSPARPHTFALFGATRGVGLALAQRALHAGHVVRALVRDRGRLEAALRLHGDEAARLHVEEGDATDEAAVARVIRGSHAVLCALGAPATRRSRVRSQGTLAIVRAMKKAGVERIVAVSVLGAGETRQKLPFFFRYLLFPLYLRRAVADHERQERILAESGLSWTAVRPPSLLDLPAGPDVVHGFDDLSGLTMTVARDEVARFMLDEVDRGAYVRAAPGISRRKVPAAG